ncbi:hypothetical protein [Corynebacterium guaraldiae]|nr:hypothetical protein [Corynebacterium guaraldiae]
MNTFLSPPAITGDYWDVHNSIGNKGTGQISFSTTPEESTAR